jgi:hypothetical protein
MRAKLCATGVAAVLTVAALSLGAGAAASKPAGPAWGAHGAFNFKTAPFVARHAFNRRRALSRAQGFPFFAGFAPGFYPGDFSAPLIIEPTVQRIDPYLPPPAHLTCHRVREIVVVPSEDGGERRIGITRC